MCNNGRHIKTKAPSNTRLTSCWAYSYALNCALNCSIQLCTLCRQYYSFTNAVLYFWRTNVKPASTRTYPALLALLFPCSFCWHTFQTSPPPSFRNVAPCHKVHFFKTKPPPLLLHTSTVWQILHRLTCTEAKPRLCLILLSCCPKNLYITILSVPIYIYI